ncbi:MAG: hypothetical protein ACJ76N_04390 [Thermoanaerobaculia bacterium]
MRSVTLGFALWILCLAAAWAQAPKALLRIDKAPLEPLDVAVFDAGAATFDQPLAFLKEASPAGVEIPAGDLLIALRSGRKAPDLHLLKVQPGATAHLEYRSSEGWSLFLRVRDLRTGRPVPSAVVSLGPDRRDTTGADGLALFPGIAANAADVAVRHPDFVSQTMAGISAASGALAFREVSLEAGGHVRAWVRVKGQPREGARCRMTVRDLSSSARPEERSRVVYEGRASRQGLCQTERVPAGAYQFSVQLAEGQAPVQRAVLVTDGQDSQEDFSFSEVRVHGTVTRGEVPVPGLTVRAVEAQGPALGMEAARTATNPDGTYELTLPRGGRYRFELLPNPKGPPALERGVVVSEGGDNALDFALQKAVVQGSILDLQGRPIEGAWVRLRWNDVTELTQKTDKDGRFTFFLEATGSGVLTSGKEGYRDGPPQEIELDEEDTDPFPVVVTLTKQGGGG